MVQERLPTRLFVRTSLDTKLVLAEKPGCPTSLLDLQLAVSAAHPRQCPEHGFAVRCTAVETIQPDDLQGYKLTESCTTAGDACGRVARTRPQSQSTVLTNMVQMPTLGLSTTETSACMLTWNDCWCGPCLTTCPHAQTCPGPAGCTTMIWCLDRVLLQESQLETAHGSLTDPGVAVPSHAQHWLQVLLLDCD